MPLPQPPAGALIRREVRAFDEGQVPASLPVSRRVRTRSFGRASVAGVPEGRVAPTLLAARAREVRDLPAAA